MACHTAGNDFQKDYPTRTGPVHLILSCKGLLVEFLTSETAGRCRAAQDGWRWPPFTAPCPRDRSLRERSRIRADVFFHAEMMVSKATAIAHRFSSASCRPSFRRGSRWAGGRAQRHLESAQTLSCARGWGWAHVPARAASRGDSRAREAEGAPMESARGS